MKPLFFSNAELAEIDALARAGLDKRRLPNFEFLGKRYFAKRLMFQKHQAWKVHFVRFCVKRFFKQPLPDSLLTKRDFIFPPNYEVLRLKAMQNASVLVPQIPLETADFFVLEAVGNTVANLLETWNKSIWLPEMQRLAQELGQFHAHNLWHGGAQIRNLTLHEAKTYRIDFEECFGDYLPLPFTQAIDLLLFLNSISLAASIDEQESRQLLPQLLSVYFAAHPKNAEIKQVLRRLLPLLGLISFVATPFLRFSKKGIRRILILRDVLKSV